MVTAIKFHVGVEEADRPRYADLVPGLTYLVKWSRLDSAMRAQIERVPTAEHSFLEFWVFLDDEFEIGAPVAPKDDGP